LTEPGSFLSQGFAKLMRAEHHAGALQREVDTWIAARSKTPLAFSAEFQEAQNRFAYRVAPFSQDLPSSWPLIIGDALTNLRAALDYAAWQLVAMRSDPTPISETRVQFPLIWKWPEDSSGHARFMSEVPRRLPGVDPRYIEVVDKHQPYHWADHEVTQRAHDPHDYERSNIGRAERHPLALLDRLSNHDKHRELQVVAELGVAMRAEVVDQEACDVVRMVPSPEQPRLSPGVDLLHVYVRRTGAARPRLKTRLDLDIVPAFDLSILEEPSLEITMALDVISRQVRVVLNDISRAHDADRA
jgi:hypothetical protein